MKTRSKHFLQKLIATPGRIVWLLFLDTGLKSNELFLLTRAHVDISDPYNPELWIKHSGKQSKKDRSLVTGRFTAVYTQYLEKYSVEDQLFPFTDRFMQMLFVELKRKTGIEKELTPKTLRHMHVVRAYKRGEGFDSSSRGSNQIEMNFK